MTNSLPKNLSNQDPDDYRCGPLRIDDDDAGVGRYGYHRIENGIV